MQVDFGDEAEEPEHNLHLTAGAHYEHARTGGSPAYSSFRHPGGRGVPAIDPGLDQSTGAGHNGHAPMSAVSHHQTSPNHLLQPDNAGHLAHHGFYGDMRSSQTPPASSHPSPRYSIASPTSQPKQLATYVPDDRSPPPRDVSDQTIDDAYATFILYCNPNFPTAIDTNELLKLFRTPPKSDGNAFSTWTLFELIRKFDAKEIKTWTQLALDLGVKPPNTDEGQSTQKVQQYSVRLKVWLFQYTPYSSQTFLYSILSIPCSSISRIFLPTASSSCLSLCHAAQSNLGTPLCDSNERVVPIVWDGRVIHCAAASEAQRCLLGPPSIAQAVACYEYR